MARPTKRACRGSVMHAKVLAAVGLVLVAGVAVVVVTSVGGRGGQGIATKHVGRTKMDFSIITDTLEWENQSPCKKKIPDD